jgi:hypothetical protein
MEAADHRLARRVRIGVRVALYSGLLALIVIALHARNSGAQTKTGGLWQGSTSQGRAITAIISADGVLTHLDTHVIEECSDGSTFDMRWHPFQHRFAQDGRKVHGRQAWSSETYAGDPDEGEASLDGRIDGHPQGTIQVTDTVTPPGHIPVRCESGPVTFTLKRA